MLQLQTLSTDGLPPGKRLEFWNETACQTLATQLVEPLRPQQFSGWMRRADFNDLRFIEFSSEPVTVVRSREHIAQTSEPPLYVLRVQLSSDSISHQDGRETRLRPGDFTLCDGTRPYKVIFHERAATLALRIPRATLLRYLGSPDDAILVPMSGFSGASALASKCLLEFWNSSAQWLTPALAPRITNILMELIASAYAALPRTRSDRSSLSTALRVRVLAYIEDHLQDGDLTPTSIAQAFRITPRYLHLLFHGESETAARYVLRRRLDRCSQALADPAQRDRSIAWIASNYGFKSLPHFCRVFREQYGLRPSDFRAAAEANIG
jgi:AraC-like DNA-binding protein